ncbi:hypothetical protein FA95DRAFT_1609343 [Auriscalpium vulgare]|uniref:Uncharacterized protein n=1 Tax=Auriscalpium vulgare TaxID=40419 RepID=A0ACB8RGX8_9AGAM|nr:hypothetical protein FA95DRAFT_1609343 [Auriscalpium vulgare]
MAPKARVIVEPTRRAPPRSAPSEYSTSQRAESMPGHLTLSEGGASDEEHATSSAEGAEGDNENDDGEASGVSDAAPESNVDAAGETPGDQNAEAGPVQSEGSEHGWDGRRSLHQELLDVNEASSELLTGGAHQSL